MRSPFWRFLSAACVAVLVASVAVTTTALGQDDEDAGAEPTRRVNELPELATDLSEGADLFALRFNVTKVAAYAPLDGPFKGKVYWYAVYTIENKTDSARDAFVSITASSDRGKFYADQYLRSVEAGIERKVGRPLWGKTDLFEAQKERDPKLPSFHKTTFEAGEKRRCVAIFNTLDPEANKIKISVRGLSNDLRMVTAEDGSRAIRERVFELEYERPEDVYEINLDRFIFRSKRWTERTTPIKIPQ